MAVRFEVEAGVRPGLLRVRVFARNDTDRPVMLDGNVDVRRAFFFDMRDAAMDVRPYGRRSFERPMPAVDWTCVPAHGRVELRPLDFYLGARDLGREGWLNLELGISSDSIHYRVDDTVEVPIDVPAAVA
jgi:hypothetical protein